MGYLTEEKLNLFLTNKFGDENIKKQYRLPNKKIVDYVISDAFFNFELNKSIKTNIAIEFDGNHHYQQKKVINRDIENQIILHDMGFHVIHIPYFVQANFVFPFYFNTMHPEEFYGENKSSYPNGFIDEKCVRPIDFSFDGWNRFIYEVSMFPKLVREEIYFTMSIKENRIHDEMKEKYFKETYELYNSIKWITHCMF